MNIKIDDTYSLTSNAHQWAIKKFSGVDKSGRDTFETLGYHTKPGDAIKALANYEIRTAECSTFKEALVIIDGLKEKYDKLLSVLQWK